MSEETPPTSAEDISARLERIERSLDRMSRLFEQITVAGPSMAATLMDIGDELAAGAQAKGVDIDAVLRAALLLLTRGAELMQSPEMAQLAGSGALSPESAAAMAELGDALVATRDEPAGKAGLWALVRASRDPDVQRALDFAIRLMKRVGRAMADREPGDQEESHG